MMESSETLLNNHWLGNRGGSLSFLFGTISNVLVMEIGWTDVGSGGYILVSCAHSNTSVGIWRVSLKIIQPARICTEIIVLIVIL